MLNITAARRTARPKLEINVAPLIDMVFILLIFFLVTTSFVKESGVDINRPAAFTAVSREKADIIVGIRKDNTIVMDREEIDIRSVRWNVERALVENPEAEVVVLADEQSLTGTAVTVIDACRLAGAKNVSLGAHVPGEAAPR